MLFRYTAHDLPGDPLVKFKLVTDPSLPSLRDSAQKRRRARPGWVAGGRSSRLFSRDSAQKRHRARLVGLPAAQDVHLAVFGPTGALRHPTDVEEKLM